MRRAGLAAMVAIGAAAFPSKLAMAEGERDSDEATPAPPIEPSPYAPRLRLDVAASVIRGVAYPSWLTGDFIGAGLTLDVGAQFGNRFALYARAQAYTPLTFEGAAYATAEWIPLDWLSVGSGLGYQVVYGPFGSSVPTGGGFNFNAAHWSGLSVPVLVAFNITVYGAPDRPPRIVLRFGLDTAAGFDPATDTAAWYVATSAGVALM